MFRLGRFTFTPGFFLMLGLSAVIGASDVLPLVAVAALLHEMGHLAALSCFEVHVEGMNFTAYGAEIMADTRYLSYGRDVLCTLAGPAANIAAALVLSRVSGDYLLAGANIIQGCFNLLPMTGLDGARALHLLLSWWLGPVRADRVSRAVEWFCAAMITLAALYLVVRHRTGGFLLMAMPGIFVSIWRETGGK